MTDNAEKAAPRTTAAQIGGVALAVAAGLFLPPGLNWITALVGFAVFLAALGLQVSRRPAGALTSSAQAQTDTANNHTDRFLKYQSSQAPNP